jgi:hypothetical protein
MDRDDAVGIYDLEDGRVALSLQLREREGLRTRKYDSLEKAYQEIELNVPSIKNHLEIFDLYKQKGPELFSKLPGDRQEWAAFCEKWLQNNGK